MQCTDCRAVKRTVWTCPLFASAYLLIASVEQTMAEEEVVSLSESSQGNYDILLLKKTQGFKSVCVGLSQTVWTVKGMVISQPQGRASVTSEFTIGLLYPN